MGVLLSAMEKKPIDNIKTYQDVPKTVRALWLEKNTREAPNIISSAAAARGHILEPYAIEEFNVFNESKRRYYHWDDCLIFNGEFAASPDGLTIEQPPTMIEVNVNSLVAKPTEGIEVKSYTNVEHLEAFMTSPEKHKELIQLAVMFKVIDSLEKMVLLFYNPDAPEDISMFAKEFTRDYLQTTIDKFEDCKEYYKHCEALLNSMKGNYLSVYSSFSIYNRYEKSKHFLQS
jgi:hypothetical protein